MSQTKEQTKEQRDILHYKLISTLPTTDMSHLWLPIESIIQARGVGVFTPEFFEDLEAIEEGQRENPFIKSMVLGLKGIEKPSNRLRKYNRLFDKLEKSKLTFMLEFDEYIAEDEREEIMSRIKFLELSLRTTPTALMISNVMSNALPLEYVDLYQRVTMITALLVEVSNMRPKELDILYYETSKIHLMNPTKDFADIVAQAYRKTIDVTACGEQGGV